MEIFFVFLTKWSDGFLSVAQTELMVGISSELSTYFNQYGDRLYLSTFLSNIEKLIFTERIYPAISVFFNEIADFLGRKSNLGDIGTESKLLKIKGKTNVNRKVKENAQRKSNGEGSRVVSRNTYCFQSYTVSLPF